MMQDNIPRYHTLDEKFPEKIVIDNIFTKKEHTYVKERRAQWLVTMRDEAVGSSHCSLCGAAVDLFDKYCRHCGAKTTGRNYGSEFGESF